MSLCSNGVQTIYQFLNCVDRPSKTGVTKMNVRHAFSQILPSRLVQEETIETGFSHKSVRKQEVFACKKTLSYWWKKAPHQPITKLWQNTFQLLRNRGKLWEGRRRKSDSDSVGDRDSDRDTEF